MGYAADYDDYEQDAQGQEHGKQQSEHEKMCERFGYSIEEFSELSGNEQSQIRWNWRNIQKRK